MATAADDRQHWQTDMLVGMTQDTRTCMRNRAQSLLRRGENDSEVLLASIEAYCARALYSYMTRNLQHPEDKTQAYIESLAIQELSQVQGSVQKLRPGTNPVKP